MDNKPRTYTVEEQPKGIQIRVLVLILISVAIGAFAISIGALYDNYKVIKSTDEQIAEAEAAMEANGQYDFADQLRISTVDSILEENRIKAYSNAQVAAMDMSIPSGVTMDELKMVTRGNLKGIEEAFYRAEHENQINGLFVLGIASHESAYGTVCFRPNNLFGFGTHGYPTKTACVDTVAHALATNYMNGGKYSKGNTIDSVNKRYAADPAWDKKVCKKVTGFYATIAAAREKRLELLK